MASFVTLLVLSATIRAAYQSEMIPDQPIRADAREYVRAAFNLYHHGVFSTALAHGDSPPAPDGVRTPGYPVFLALFFVLTDSWQQWYRMVTTAQALLGIGTVLCTFLLARRSLPPLASFTATLLVCLCPQVIALEANLLTETLFTSVLVGSTLLAVHAWEEESRIRLLTAGAGFGIAALIRPSALLLGPGLALFVLLFCFRGQDGRWMKRCRIYGLFVAGVLLAMSPSLLRNAIVLGSPFTEGGRLWGSFLSGSYPGMYHKDPYYFGFPYREDPEYSSMEGDPATAWRILSERVTQEPWRYLRWYVLGGKLRAMWEWDMAQGSGDVYVYPLHRYPFASNSVLRTVYSVMRFAHYPILLAASCGLVLALWHSRGGVGTPKDLIILTCVGMVGYHGAQLLILFPLPRYTVPLRPYMYFLAALGIAEGFRCLKGKLRTRTRDGL